MNFRKFKEEVIAIFEEVIRPLMSERRFQHCVNVAKKAEELAVRYHGNTEKAHIAGMLHDITKEFSYDEHMKIFKKYNSRTDRYMKISKGLLHANSGSLYVRNVLKINDFEILNAIKYHTTGRANMGFLEKIVFVADWVSAERDFDGVDNLRFFAFKNLDLAVIRCLAYAIGQLVHKGIFIHSNSFHAYNHLIFAKMENSRYNVNFSANFKTSSFDNRFRGSYRGSF